MNTLFKTTAPAESAKSSPSLSDDTFSDLDITLSDEWQANGFPLTHRELKELEEEKI